MWDTTCVDTFCDSHKPTTAREAGGAATLAKSGKAKKYTHLDHAYLFQPVALKPVEQSGLSPCLFSETSVNASGL